MSEENSLNKGWIPFIPIREMVIYPIISIPFFIGRKRSLKALEQALKTDKILFAVTQKESDVDEPTASDLYSVGVLGRIVRILKLPNNTIKVIFEGITVARASKYEFGDKQQLAFIDEHLAPKSTDIKEVETIKTLIKTQFKNYAQRNHQLPENIGQTIAAEKNPLHLCYRLAPLLQLSLAEKQAMLENNDLNKLIGDVYSHLIKEEESFKIEEMTRDKINKQISKNQKEYYLNEQLRAIQKELGNEDQKSEFKELEQKIIKSGMPKDVLQVAKKELHKLEQMPQASSETNIVRNYLDWLIGLPWKDRTKDNLNLKHAKDILDADHYGLTEIKDRVIEFLALLSRSKKLRGPIICLSGPPGVGKTSLAKSIAKVLGRKFVRMSLGGVRDEAEIRGHRRTYVGAMPGKIISAMKKSNSINPVILLDEIDKLTVSHLGNPAAALLEALDPEQNSQFVDHYLEVEYDLSNVLFICTANNQYEIPHALRDRMETINLVGYSQTEKVHIFNQHLWKKQLAENMLKPSQVSISDLAVLELINGYTKEAGIRELERTLAKILRKVNRQLLTYRNIKKIEVDKDNLITYLGTAKFREQLTENTPQVGVVNGLAWTSVGGDLLIIEAVKLKGNGKLKLTGKLGEVMKESAQAAYSFVKANANLFAIPETDFEKFDIHIHAPEGAVPKDGPSAGVSVTTAIVSALTGIAVKNYVAMTGEITLHGNILPIGGLKEKLLAALRYGVKEVFIPKKNLLDLADFTEDIKKDLSDLKISNYSDLYRLVCDSLVELPTMKDSSSGKSSPVKKISKNNISQNN